MRQSSLKGELSQILQQFSYGSLLLINFINSFKGELLEKTVNIFEHKYILRTCHFD